jgi:hypothetical protein
VQSYIYKIVTHILSLRRPNGRPRACSVSHAPQRTCETPRLPFTSHMRGPHCAPLFFACIHVGTTLAPAYLPARTRGLPTPAPYHACRDRSHPLPAFAQYCTRTRECTHPACECAPRDSGRLIQQYTLETRNTCCNIHLKIDKTFETYANNIYV